MSRKRTREEKQALVAKWKRSGEIAAKFGETIGVSAATLHNWSSTERKAAQKEQTPTFVEVEIASSAASSASEDEAFTLELCSGWRLSFSTQALPEEVVRWARMLDEAC